MQRGKVSDDQRTPLESSQTRSGYEIEFGLTGDIALQIIFIVDENHSQEARERYRWVTCGQPLKAMYLSKSKKCNLTATIDGLRRPANQARRTVVDEATRQRVHSHKTSGLGQLKMRVGFVSRLGASPGYCVTTVASAKTANPKIKVSQTTSSLMGYRLVADSQSDRRRSHLSRPASANQNAKWWLNKNQSVRPQFDRIPQVSLEETYNLLFSLSNKIGWRINTNDKPNMLSVTENNSADSEITWAAIATRNGPALRSSVAAPHPSTAKQNASRSVTSDCKATGKNVSVCGNVK